MADTLLIEHNPKTEVKNDFESVNFDDITDSFLEEKGGTRIEKELNDFDIASSSEKDKINEKVEVENFEQVEDGLDSLGSNENTSEESSEESSEEEEEQQGEIEDYFESAEFLIWILELAIVFGTNFYLKNQQLDSIGIEEFERTKAQQKRFVKSVSKVLMKHNAKISPEAELLFQLGANYVMQIGSIVKRQKARKEEEIKNRVKKPVVKQQKKTSVVRNKTTKKEAENFKQAEEVLTVVEDKVENPVVEDKEETRDEMRLRIRAENKEKRKKEKKNKFGLNGVIEEV
jgi:hypothetical protein